MPELHLDLSQIQRTNVHGLSISINAPLHPQSVRVASDSPSYDRCKTRLPEASNPRLRSFHVGEKGWQLPRNKPFINESVRGSGCIRIVGKPMARRRDTRRNRYLTGSWTS